ncbi:DUF4376 domain-containing protein [Acinetobacter sp. KS-LM10]|uniref:DUF4376 domain-containing protein n=1 Tax=Acinetobacter sp. KS-LM10 TaxID=3120518 RepID=UPI0030D44C25
MTTIVNSHGKPLFRIGGDAKTISLNTPKGCVVVEDPPNSNMFYQDGWVDMPSQPSSNHIFEYDLKQWVDPRTIEQVKEQKWAEIKSLRDQLEFSGFEFEGDLYDSDQVSQGRIMGAASAQIDQTWTLANNETVDLTAIQLSQLYQSLQLHIANTHERGRIARQLIYEATSIEQVEQITL